MQVYTYKSDILESMWKDKKDTRFLERAIDRWEVIDYGNCYIKKEELIAEAMKLLKIENELLKKEVDKNINLKQELAEEKVNVEYYKEEVVKAEQKTNDIIDSLKKRGLIRSASDLLLN